VTLHVDEAGDLGAPAVVLLHAVGISGWMWARQVAALAPDLHVLVPDLPGHGRSSPQAWVSITDTAAAVTDAVTARLGGGRAHVAGLSLGGYVALHLAATAPPWVSGATVSGVNVLPFPHPRRMRLLGAAMGPFLHLGPLLRAKARALRIPPEDVAAYTAVARTSSRRAVRRATDDAIGFRVPPGAAESPLPVLAVAGGDEHDLTRRSVDAIAAAFPAGRGRLVPGAGHAWNAELPDVFSAMIRAQVLGGDLPPELAPAA
jgi:pimeloyl-ACP methyl ester carboxylesterase